MLHLRIGSKKDICPQCGKRTFKPFVDENGEVFRPEVGFCDRKDKCQYSLTPGQYWAEHPELKERHADKLKVVNTRPEPQPPTKIDTIPDDVVIKSVNPSRPSHLIKWIASLGILDPLVVEGLVMLYGIGVTKSGDTIYFQVDEQGRCRSGKIMKYDEQTGHRIKGDDPNKIDWVHSRMKKAGQLSGKWALTQCLFGQHLLAFHPDYPVALVESEKTAIICAGLMPEYIWLATGGKGVLLDRVEVLRGRKVIAFPDTGGGFEKWVEAFSKYPFIHVSDYLERIATPDQKEDGCDIADLLIEQMKTKRL